MKERKDRAENRQKRREAKRRCEWMVEERWRSTKRMAAGEERASEKKEKRQRSKAEAAPEQNKCVGAAEYRSHISSDSSFSPLNQIPAFHTKTCINCTNIHPCALMCPQAFSSLHRKRELILFCCDYNKNTQICCWCAGKIHVE